MQYLRMLLPVTLFAVGTATAAAQSPAGARNGEAPLWLRYPMISPDGETIAFTYRGRI